MVTFHGEQLESTVGSERFSGNLVAKAQAILGVSDSADEVELKRSFRLKALDVHPDKVAAHKKP